MTIITMLGSYNSLSGIVRTGHTDNITKSTDAETHSLMKTSTVFEDSPYVLECCKTSFKLINNLIFNTKSDSFMIYIRIVDGIAHIMYAPGCQCAAMSFLVYAIMASCMMYHFPFTKECTNVIKLLCNTDTMLLVFSPPGVTVKNICDMAKEASSLKSVPIRVCDWSFIEEYCDDSEFEPRSNEESNERGSNESETNERVSNESESNE